MSGSKRWSKPLDDAIGAYNAAQGPQWRQICERLAEEIVRGLPEANGKLWHGGPVWFIHDNPIVGYWARAARVQLLFWSGRSFDEPGLAPEGKFAAAAAHFSDIEQIDSALVQRWLAQSRSIQWDYRNIVKRRGRLERLTF